MKVSIISPVYNCAPYFVECIQSLLAQTCQDFEVLLVDDHGTDDASFRLLATAGPASLEISASRPQKGNTWRSSTATMSGNQPSSRSCFVRPNRQKPILPFASSSIVVEQRMERSFAIQWSRQANSRRPRSVTSCFISSRSRSASSSVVSS